MTFTKERLTELSRRENVGAILGEEIAELARIALASLEAEPAIHRWRRVTSEPYGPYPWHYGNFIGFSKPVEGIEDEYYYSAPPAPVSVPHEVLKRLLPDAEKAEFWFEHDGKILFEGVKFNNAVFEACRAAMLKHSEPFIVTSDHRMMEMPQVEAINAMLQGAEHSKIDMLCKVLKNAPLSPSDSQGRKKVDMENDNQQFESLSGGNK